MKITSKEFFYTSIECKIKELPVRAFFVCKLTPITGDLKREVAMIKLDRTSKEPSWFPNDLVIAPRYAHDGLFDTAEDPVFLYVLYGDKYLNATEIDLVSAHNFADIGVISHSQEEVLKMTVTEEGSVHKPSEEFLKQYEEIHGKKFSG